MTDTHQSLDFLRIPPFPGALVKSFSTTFANADHEADLVELVRSERVGGAYWASQPQLPPRYALVRSVAARDAISAVSAGPVVTWLAEPPAQMKIAGVVIGDCDPWHMLHGADLLVTSEEDDEVALLAALVGAPIKLLDPRSSELTTHTIDVRSALADRLFSKAYLDPFTGKKMSARQAVQLCGFWRRLIDSNRGIAGGLGFAHWKQGHVAPLLWAGTKDFEFLRDVGDVGNQAIAVWRAKSSSRALKHVHDARIPVVEVEDGFLRSQGLGADCVPPLSISVDRLGAYFDPSRASELELLLEECEFDHSLLRRARHLRESIVQAGLAKYERGSSEALNRPAGSRRHILVPGQVEDDRAVQSGGCGLVSNLDLVARVRASAPEAYILYKPHPDVVAGHRRGAIRDRDCLQYVDDIVTDASISSLIDMVDEVHVNTSLTGFEALMRQKAVVCHGVPFYAGWGLTCDLGPVPARRTARRSLDELVAATLMLYPRYLDPITGLPCPPEVVVDRLARREAPSPGLLVRVRRLQGKLMRRVRDFR